MSRKLAILVVFLLVITNIVVIYCYYNEGKKTDITSIDSLLIINDSLDIANQLLNDKVDSLLIEISKVDSTIVEINNTYEKDSNNITNQHISEDIMFFSNYLSKNNF